ncbi:hypothetical protein D3C85_1488280 [compost metagenome]
MMRNNPTCKSAGTPKACPQNAVELFYLSHPKMAKSLLGPFLSEADAECGRIVMRSPGAVVTSALVEHLDEFTRWKAINNGQVMRHFAKGAI